MQVIDSLVPGAGKRHLELLRASSDDTGRKVFPVLEDIITLDDEAPRRKALSTTSTNKLRDAYELIGEVLDAAADEDEDEKAPRRRGRRSADEIDLDAIDGDELDISDPQVAELIESVLRDVVAEEMQAHTGKVAPRRAKR